MKIPFSGYKKIYLKQCKLLYQRNNFGSKFKKIEFILSSQPMQKTSADVFIVDMKIQYIQRPWINSFQPNKSIRYLYI